MEDMKPGMILSREEGRAARDVVSGAYKAGYIDIVTTVEMQYDVVCRTVPS